MNIWAICQVVFDKKVGNFKKGIYESWFYWAKDFERLKEWRELWCGKIKIRHTVSGIVNGNAVAY